MAELVIRNVTKSFGSLRVVEDVSLTVKDGEFFTLLGPSGCGKSTLLAMIAGLEAPDAGTIQLDDSVFVDVARRRNMATERRNLGLVFQSYALWPHMTVYGNIEFPLKLRRLGRARRRAKADEILQLVELAGMGDRYPHQLSGGQQQRAALARTLAYEPSLLLLDEPLSNLDAKLRERARIWLGELQRRVGVTTIYVTHDQAEALALSDRIAVMQNGRIMQVGDPITVYEQPVSLDVADFIGTTNFLSGQVVDAGRGWLRLLLSGTPNSTIVLECDDPLPIGQTVTIALRPEQVTLRDWSDVSGEQDANAVRGATRSRVYVGGRHQYEVAIGDGLVRSDAASSLLSQDMRVSFPRCGSPIFPTEGASASEPTLDQGSKEVPSPRGEVHA